MEWVRAVHDGWSGSEQCMMGSSGVRAVLMGSSGSRAVHDGDGVGQSSA